MIQLHRLKIEQLRKLRVRTRSVIESGQMSIPIGTEVKILRKWAGKVDISAPECPHCGVRIYVRKVNPIALEEIEDGEAPSTGPGGRDPGDRPAGVA